MTIYQMLVFAGAASLLVMSPGPNAALIAKTVPVAGRRAGMANVGGFVAAFYLHGALSIIGVSVLLVRSAQLYTVVKLAGAMYLIWIGAKALRTAWQLRGLSGHDETVDGQPADNGHFLVGFVTNALNPKVSVFYLAAFPQFVPEGASAGWAVLLVLIHSMINGVWFTALVLVFGRLAAASRTIQFKRRIQVMTGFVFIGFGSRLATTR